MEVPPRFTPPTSEDTTRLLPPPTEPEMRARSTISSGATDGFSLSKQAHEEGRPSAKAQDVRAHSANHPTCARSEFAESLMETRDVVERAQRPCASLAKDEINIRRPSAESLIRPETLQKSSSVVVSKRKE
ncbi:unnamed protein product [Caenorhabditis auriculariae]|uniref:Uncharacterized protein n=1 Tax=Caenorhabditis auriculariae TaxID=2777116 RepID=A0A8S1GY91_9PELO|nr:unnamed protein product [Caenorhabditis auriculariae]